VVGRRTHLRHRIHVALGAALLASLAACSTADDDAPTNGAIEVVDGDTIIVERDGFDERVRIVGINTPESGECLADAAGERLAELLADQTIELIRDTSDVDSFGRLLRYVEVVSGPGAERVDVGGTLVAEGLAIARRYEPDVARASTYERLQDAARSDGLGLWAPNACGTATVGSGAIEVTVNADPPGDDTDALDGEWVEFTNTTGDEIDLDGFTVADESASNRFVFDNVVLAPLGTLRLVTGCGTDTDTVVHWCASGSAVWNNDGDTVFLRDRSGNIVVATTYPRP
jgi:micrococcal nuclease